MKVQKRSGDHAIISLVRGSSIPLVGLWIFPIASLSNGYKTQNCEATKLFLIQSAKFNKTSLFIPSFLMTLPYPSCLVQLQL